MMRREGIGRQSSGATETAAVDLFMTLFLVATLSINPHPAPKAAEVSKVAATQHEVVVTGDSLFFDHTGPLSEADLAARIEPDNQVINMRVAPGVSVEREHAVNELLAAHGAQNVTIVLGAPDGDVR